MCFLPFPLCMFSDHYLTKLSHKQLLKLCQTRSNLLVTTAYYPHVYLFSIVVVHSRGQEAPQLAT